MIPYKVKYTSITQKVHLTFSPKCNENSHEQKAHLKEGKKTIRIRFTHVLGFPNPGNNVNQENGFLNGVKFIQGALLQSIMEQASSMYPEQ